MNGLIIRLSRFTGPGGLIITGDLLDAGDFSSAAMLVYPDQIPVIWEKMPPYAAPLLLVCLTYWTGTNLIPLVGAREAAVLGGDGCVVDLISGYEDSLEIESMRVLAFVVEEAHCLGLPVIAQLRFNEAGREELLSDCLAVPLAAAEEIGADAVIIPEETGRQYSSAYSPALPLFLAGKDGLIRRFNL